MNTLIIENFIIGVFYFIIGALAYKYPNMIAGYNTASDKEKESIDIENYKSKMRKGFFTIGFISCLLGVLSFFYKNEVVNIAFIIALPILLSVWLLIHYEKCKTNTSTKKRSHWLIVCIIIFSIIFMTTISILLYNHSNGVNIKTDEKTLTIKGTFGASIAYNEIIKIELNNTLPPILLRTWGAAINNDLRGKFKVKGIDNCRLYVRTSNPPFIKIWRTNGEIIYINQKDSISTLNLYQLIQQQTTKQ